ncbi:unnamed protein product [Paramecium octaurelia]|uniref:SET domain-containing protein n=1 Tax=Paramecium octaurelia TaxID=43137 RepID=A0A8S1VYP9_PAROT|nr:unnamed protein product [Paramecium octaurelia]
MSLKRAKGMKVKQSSSAEEEKKSDSISKQIKKQRKKNNMVGIVENKKKVKTQVVKREDAWKHLETVVDLLVQSDPKNILDSEELSGLIAEFENVESNPKDSYREWFDKEYEYQYDETAQLMKPINFRSNLCYLHQFRKRVEYRQYWDIQEIIKDLHKLFGNIYMKCQNQQSYYYLSKVWEGAKPKIRTVIQEFSELIKEEVYNILKMNTEFKVSSTIWPVVPEKKEIRTYQEIQDYEPNPNEEPHISQIKEKLSSKKVPVKCKSDCVCFDLSRMGTFNYSEIKWDSECPNRSNRIECREHEGTDRPCSNMQIQLKQYLINRTNFGDNADVEETLCWGIDVYTRNVIINILPLNYVESQKNQFIEKLILAINRPNDKERGYDMGLACDYIIRESRMLSSYYNKDDRKMAKSIKRVIKLDGGGFRIHTKGCGLVCVNKFGIKTNSLIIPYLGEIYQPWRWYEKQDFIKKQMKEQNKKDILPDFYNIMLDRHLDDEDGIDILFVDPINKGNFSSRLSHSCNPNCGTVTTVSNGTYVIGMYAMRDIQFGEELTFDYCSFTESKQEQLQALCLCGSENCKKYYLGLSNQREYNAILDRNHCFLKRNAILFNSCLDNFKIDQRLLDKYKIRSSLLTGCPFWLKCWICQLLVFIDEEYIIYKAELDTKFILNEETEKWNQFTAQLHSEERIQNLIFTLDKIKFFLKQSDTVEPPLSKITNEDLIMNFWGMTNESLLSNELYQLFQKHGLKKLMELIVLIQDKRHLYDVQEQLLLTRLLFLVLSHLLLQQKQSFYYEGLSLILQMMAFTYTYFKPTEYKGFQSPPIEDLEWGKVGLIRRKCKAEGKNYSSLFAWGQLVGWYKQTVAAPQLSLGVDRRGTLLYPQISSFDSNSEKQASAQQEKNKTDFIYKYLEKRFNITVAEMSYKTNQKYFGTVFFEQVYSQELGSQFLDRALVYDKKDFNVKFKQFLKYEKLKFNHSSEQIHKLMDHFKNVVQVPKQRSNRKKIEEIKSEERQEEDELLFKRECLITQEI